MDFDVIVQLLIRYSAFIRYWRKKLRTMVQYMSYVYILRRPMTQSGEKYGIIFGFNLV